MRIDIFEDDHREFRKTVRSYLERDVVPHYADWEAAGQTDPEAFRSAMQLGVYGLQIPERFGGAGILDYRYRIVVSEELARARATSLSVSLTSQDDMFLPYLLDIGTSEQLERWMPRLATGESIGAVAMTEPGAGSDLRGIRTRAERDGDGWVLNGNKVFITHGTVADLVIVVAQTESGLSLFVVERGTPGFGQGKRLAKLGLHAQDTAELSFDDVRLPGHSMLGDEGSGFRQLLTHLARERLGTIACAVADARAVYDFTVTYCAQREAFGRPIGDFQANRFSLAEMETEIGLAEMMLDQYALAFNAGTLTAVDAAKGKWWSTELQLRVIDRCLQLHGGYGFMMESAVTKAYADARVQTIYGGTTEIMKDLIGKQIMKKATALSGSPQ